MGGRTHDYYCTACHGWYSPFTFDACPCGADPDRAFYDLNREAEDIDSDTGRPLWMKWLEGE